jgi:hypothetical protein
VCDLAAAAAQATGDMDSFTAAISLAREGAAPEQIGPMNQQLAVLQRQEGSRQNGSSLPAVHRRRDADAKELEHSDIYLQNSTTRAALWLGKNHNYAVRRGKR